MLHRWLLLHGGRWDSIPSREGFRSLFHFRLFFVRNYLLSIYLLFVIRFTNSEFQGLGWAWSKSAKRSGGPYLIDFTVQLDGIKLRPFLKVKRSYERNLNRVLTKCIILLGL